MVNKLKYKEKLQGFAQAFEEKHNLRIIIGAEIEFYIKRDLDTPSDLIIADISNLCEELDISDVKKEKGRGQYEISFNHCDEPVLMARRVCEAKSILQNMNIGADFSPKPYDDDYGSALHINISLLNSSGKNVFSKKGDNETDFMLYAIAGLLEIMPDSMDCFTEGDDSKKRFVRGFDAPTKISWGGNNRTVALRIPTSTTDPENRRIEHRVPSANANPFKVISEILRGIDYGLSKKIKPKTDKIYGDASDEQYNLPDLFQTN